MVNIGICLLSHLKEELAWAADKWFQVISYLKNSYNTKKLRGTKG